MATYSKSHRTKEHILQVAYDLFLTNGYRTTSLKDIAKAADVSTGTLYRYFPSKGDLLAQTKRSTIDHLHEVHHKLPEEMPLIEKIKKIIREDLAGVSRRLDLDGADELSGPFLELALASRYESFSSLEQLQREEAFRSELRSIYKAIIEDEQSKGRFDPNVDAMTLAMAISAVYFQTVDQMIVNPSLDPEEIITPKLKLLLEDHLTSPDRA